MKIKIEALNIFEGSGIDLFRNDPTYRYIYGANTFTQKSSLINLVRKMVKDFRSKDIEYSISEETLTITCSRKGISLNITAILRDVPLIVAADYSGETSMVAEIAGDLIICCVKHVLSSKDLVEKVITEK